MSEHALKPIIDLELSMRSSDVLRGLSIKTVAELLALSPAQLLAAEQSNAIVLAEIEDVLEELGLSLAEG